MIVCVKSRIKCVYYKHLIGFILIVLFSFEWLFVVKYHDLFCYYIITIYICHVFTS